VAFLPIRGGNAFVAKNAIEECASGIRDQQSSVNLAKHLGLGALKADNEIYLLPISSDAYPMSRVETRRDIVLIFCNSPLESGNDFLASFSVLDNRRAEDFVPMKITFGWFPLGTRVQ